MTSSVCRETVKTPTFRGIWLDQCPPPAFLAVEFYFMPAGNFSVLTFAMLAAFAVTAVAQDVESGAERTVPGLVPSAMQEPDAALQDSVGRLVSDLSAPMFAKRQKATAQLLQLEAPAVALLEVKLETATEPVAVQLRQVIPKLRKRLFDDRVAALESDQKLTDLTGMPDWDRFVRITGNAEAALPVYLEMLRTERALFADRMFSSSELSEHLEERTKVLRAACNGELEEEFPVASAAALMLIASDENVILRRATSTNISESLQDSRFGKLITDGFHADTLRALTSEWLKRPGIAADRPLLLSIEFKLPVGREVALRTIERRVYNQSAAYSLLCLGALQQTDSLSVVEQVLNDEMASRPVWPPRGETADDLISGRKIESTYSVQARDVALAVAIHLRGRRPKEFGIHVMSSEVNLFTFDSMGFNNDNDRNAAISKYRAAFP